MLYFVRRVLVTIPTVILATALIFVLVHIAPGGPERVMLGDMQSPELVAKIRSQLGLDLPIHIQYLRWMKGVIQFDLGESFSVQRGAPVSQLIGQRFAVTAELALLSIVLAVALGIPAGVYSAFRRNSVADHFLRVVALLGVSIPNFFKGILLILVFGVLALLPWGAGGYVPINEGIAKNLLHMLLPALALSSGYAAMIMRMMRSSALDMMQQDYVLTANAMGIPSRSIVWRDVVRNALIPVVTVIGNSVGYLLGGAIVTETVFRLPGVGSLIMTGVYRRDFAVIQGVVLVLVLIRIIVNLIVDATYVVLDPRIRMGGSQR